MKNLGLSFFLAFISLSLFAQKEVYIPSFITRENTDLNDPNSQWCYCRSLETENFIIFWEPGFGNDPSTATGTYQVDIDHLGQVAEKCFRTYTDSLKFAIPGSSVTDRYKVMIFLLYSTEWAAYGSGQDNLVGTLHVNPAAARVDHVLAHEIGHCFQYITGCDTDGGYRYGFGPNGSGGNGFWEQCAQWMAFKVYPEQQFSVGDFTSYTRNHHLNLLHEYPRYFNFFIQDYWNYKRGTDFTGRLWRESRFPEDPVETYKRLNSISQQSFNDEIYEHAARLTTWDLPAIKPYGSAYINRRLQVPMSLTGENFWRPDSSKCIENYGYHCIKLNAPSQQREVTVHFRGLAGQNGYRNLNVNQAGWRYGFVALQENGTRVYSDMGSATYSNGINPQQSLSFSCPENCTNLWLVVSGAPQSHWKHPWDDDNSNDEQWPYEVQFENTNLLGIFNNPIHDDTLTFHITMTPAADYSAQTVALNASRIGEAFAMSPEEISAALGSSVVYYGIDTDGSLNPNSTANAPGHWYGNDSQIVNWGNSAYVFSELNLYSMEANIGQYPNRCEPGDNFTIRQALEYTNNENEKARVTLLFNISIVEEVITGIDQKLSESVVYPNPTSGLIRFPKDCQWTLSDEYGRDLKNGSGREARIDEFPSGIYLLKLRSQNSMEVIKLMKQ